MARARAALLEINSEHPEPRRIQQVVDRLAAGKIVVYPTDTIYGLGADMTAKNGVDRIYALRGLDPKKPLSLVCGSLSEASRFAIIDDDCYRQMKRLLPGPYTFVLRATREAPRVGESKRRTIGIRIPAHPVALALVRSLGRPLLSASAIVEGREDEVSDPIALAERYGSDAGIVIDAGTLLGTPSSVIDWTEGAPVVLRRGAGDLSAFEEG